MVNKEASIYPEKFLHQKSGLGVIKMPPKVPGIPVLGNANDFLYRPIEFFLVVMGGVEANRFLVKEGEEHLLSDIHHLPQLLNGIIITWL